MKFSAAKHTNGAKLKEVARKSQITTVLGFVTDFCLEKNIYTVIGLYYTLQEWFFKTTTLQFGKPLVNCQEVEKNKFNSPQSPKHILF